MGGPRNEQVGALAAEAVERVGARSAALLSKSYIITLALAVAAMFADRCFAEHCQGFGIVADHALAQLDRSGAAHVNTQALTTRPISFHCVSRVRGVPAVNLRGARCHFPAGAAMRRRGWYPSAGGAPSPLRDSLMGRPPLGQRPMTVSERVRKHRAMQEAMEGGAAVRRDRVADETRAALSGDPPAERARKLEAMTATWSRFLVTASAGGGHLDRDTRFLPGGS
jgi:hypothetical protein